MRHSRIPPSFIPASRLGELHLLGARLRRDGRRLLCSLRRFADQFLGASFIDSEHKGAALGPLLLKGIRPALRSFRRVIGRNLLGKFAGQLHEMIELRLEAARARRDRPQLDDEIVNLGFRDMRVDSVPSGPARPCVKAEDLAAPRRNYAVDFRRSLGRHGLSSRP